jgi:alpha-tubulin suppressor-like RCC1 family protein
VLDVPGGDYLGDVDQIAPGGQHSCARTLSSNLLCWGSNMRNQLGDGTTTTRMLPVYVSSP